jgi:hypothetical protein
VKQYLDGITVNDDVLKNINPLLVVNGRVNINRSHITGRGKGESGTVVIEANHMVATNRVNTKQMF